MTTQAKTKRFQSGREVFRTYIPDYRDTSKQKAPAPNKLQDEAAEFAATLVQNFDSRLSAAYQRSKA